MTLERGVGPTTFYDAYVFDQDGTIYLGDHLLPGAKRLIEELRRRDIPTRFLSNNPTKDPQDYVEKLGRLGLPTDIGDIANTVVTTTRWLKAHHPDATVFPISEEPLKKALREAGIRMSENPEEIDIVIASYDRTFKYRKLQIAFDAIWFHKRAILITTMRTPTRSSAPSRRARAPLSTPTWASPRPRCSRPRSGTSTWTRRTA